jgi:outer membrane protein
MKKYPAKNSLKERGVRHALSLALVAILTTGMNVGVAAAPLTLTQAQITVYGTSSESERVHFLIGRAKMGQVDLVNALLKRFPLQGPHAANRTLFIEGLLSANQGDLTGAAKKYRAVLAVDPKLTLVRTELAQVLVELDENDSAKHHLKLLEADAPDAAAAANIRSFIDKVDSKRPYTFSGFISVAPSTNINSGSSHTTVYSANPNFIDHILEINPSSQKQSGTGIAGGLSVGYSKRLGNVWEAVFAADINAQLYGDPNFDSGSLSESGELRYHLQQGYVGIGAVADQSFSPNNQNLFNESMDYHSYGPRASLLYHLGQRDLLRANTLYEWRDYAHVSALNGPAFLSEVALSHAVDSTLNFTLSGGYDLVNANLNFNGYRTIYGGIEVYKELPLGLTVDSSAQARFSTFSEVNPIALLTREDQRYIGAVTLTKRDLNLVGFAPSLTYTYTRNFSNIALWDYDSHAVDFRLTKDF